MREIDKRDCQQGLADSSNSTVQEPAVAWVHEGYFKDRPPDRVTAFATVSSLRNYAAQVPLYSAEQLATLQAKLSTYDKWLTGGVPAPHGR